MAQVLTADTLTIQKSELSVLLRDIVREVVREELQRFAAPETGWEIEENSVLWEDLTALQAESHAGSLKLLSHTEVFGK